MILPINSRQIKKIKTLSRQIFADDDVAYRKMLWEHARVKSCTELKGVQVDLVIRHLERCQGEKGHRPEAGATKGAAGGEKRPLWATAPQREEIKKRWGRVSRVAQEWGAESRQAHEALQKFLWRRFKTTLDWLTLPVGQKVIEALKGMAGRGPAAPGEKASL